MTHNEAHECNLDAAQREIDSRQAQGEDMRNVFMNPRTCAIEFRSAPSLTCQDAILAMLEASSPQSRQDLRRECREQAIPYDNRIFAACVDQLVASGKLVIDDEQSDEHNTVFDFPAAYYKQV